MGLVAGGRADGGAGAACEIRDGVLAVVGARLRAVLPGRAPPPASAVGRDRHFPPALFSKFLVELEQRLRQLSAHQGQCRAQRPTVPPGRLSRIPRRAIWRLWAIAVCWSDLADCDMARACRTARPPADLLCIADPGDDDRRQPAVTRPCELGG